MTALASCLGPRSRRAQARGLIILFITCQTLATITLTAAASAFLASAALGAVRASPLNTINQLAVAPLARSNDLRRGLQTAGDYMELGHTIKTVSGRQFPGDGSSISSGVLVRRLRSAHKLVSRAAV